MPPKSAAEVPSFLKDIPRIFEQAQHSIANHRKNCITLYKLHLRASEATQATENGPTCKRTGERAFEDVFFDMISRTLLMKKGQPTADRIIKFVCTYVKFVAEKPAVTEHQDSVGSDTDTDITLCERFSSNVLSWLLPGLSASDKNVRFRTVSLLAELLAHIPDLEEDTYIALKEVLIERTRDRETSVRVQGVLALSRLAGAESADDNCAEQPSILDALISSLCGDSAAEVRRAALLHIPPLMNTLDDILSRTRDVDAVTRKLVFSSILTPALSRAKSTSVSAQSRIDHPRKLSLAQRISVVRNGLCDVEEAVRVATGKMLGAWFDVIHKEIRKGATKKAKVTQALIGFIKLFDLTNEDASVALDALSTLLISRPDIVSGIVFDDTFWDTLTPETALLARAYAIHCRENAVEETSNIPVVTTLSFYLQETCNTLFDAIEDYEEAEEAERNAKGIAVVKQTVVVVELIQLLAGSDFADETGRLKVFSVVREMLAHELLPEDLLEPCLNLLQVTTLGEREFVRVAVEIINELRDGRDDEDVAMRHEVRSETGDTTQRTDRSRISRRLKESHELSPEERAEVEAIELRCLAICIGMLKGVDGNLEDNSTLEGILADLIIPAVKRKELAFRQLGLTSLGLCCLISKNIAMNSFQLFLNQVQNSPDDLKVDVLKIIFDILLLFDVEFLRNSDDMKDNIVAFLLQTLEVEESPAVQAVLCIGISKLLLGGLIDDERVLTSMVLAYVSPVTAENLELRECLAYFLPAFCYAFPENQNRMQKIFMVAYDSVARLYSELEDGQEMMTPLQFGVLLLEWTDPRNAETAIENSTFSHISENVHLELAIDILESLYDPEKADHDRRTLCQLLDKLYFPESPDPRSLFTLNVLIRNICAHPPFDDSVSHKLVEDFSRIFAKRFARALDRIDPQEYESDVRLQEIRTLIGWATGAVEEPEILENDRRSPVAQEVRRSIETETTSSSQSVSAKRKRVISESEETDVQTYQGHKDPTISNGSKYPAVSNSLGSISSSLIHDYDVLPLKKKKRRTVDAPRSRHSRRDKENAPASGLSVSRLVKSVDPTQTKALTASPLRPKSQAHGGAKGRLAETSKQGMIRPKGVTSQQRTN